MSDFVDRGTQRGRQCDGLLHGTPGGAHQRAADDDAIAHVSELVRRPLSKFQPCLPPELAARFLARRLLELPFGSEPSRG